MALREIFSAEEMMSLLKDKTKNYVLLYKKGSELSDCSFENIKKAALEMNEINVLAADVAVVKDIHTRYSISTVPTLLVFEGKNFSKTVKGCHDEKFYRSLFESALFVAKAEAGGQPQKRVTVYSTPSCSWCTTLKTHLKKHGVMYREIDVSKDENAAKEMVRKSGQQGVPQTDINGEMIIGFDKDRINTLLGIN